LSDGAAHFAARYPTVWHVIEADGAGDWLSSTGLYPAVELRRLAGLGPGGANREDFQCLDLGCGRTAVLRLQQMRDARLVPSLFGQFAAKPELWRRHVDRHVFFWAEQRRRDAFIQACMRLRAVSQATRSLRPPVVLAIDTQTLLARLASIAFFARVNTGSTVRSGARVRRDEDTLQPVSAYRSGAVAELAIRGRVELAGILLGCT
jgi:hypothetical protein